MRRPSGTGRWVMIAGVVTAGLLALAWFDGGEESLHPIAEAVPLPESTVDESTAPESATPGSSPQPATPTTNIHGSRSPAHAEHSKRDPFITTPPHAA